jgi:hypothetical protein
MATGLESFGCLILCWKLMAAGYLGARDGYWNCGSEVMNLGLLCG